MIWSIEWNAKLLKLPLTAVAFISDYHLWIGSDSVDRLLDLASSPTWQPEYICLHFFLPLLPLQNLASSKQDLSLTIFITHLGKYEFEPITSRIFSNHFLQTRYSTCYRMQNSKWSSPRPSQISLKPSLRAYFKGRLEGYWCWHYILGGRRGRRGGNYFLWVSFISVEFQAI